LTGLLNGLSDLLTSIPCSGALGIGGDVSGCRTAIRDTLAKTTTANTGGQVSNALSVLAGLLKPLLDAIGTSVLTPLLQNVLGMDLGQVDLNLKSLDCKPLPMLVS